MKTEIRKYPFDPWDEVRRHQAGRPDLAGNYGATAVFVGTMRGLNEGDRVTRMRLEHYPGMTDAHLEQITAAAAKRWEIQDVLVVHRTGEVAPGDPIVLVAVWSAHRAAAYEANRFIMEDLKSRAPFWKKETLEGGDRWVESNTPG
ncbi:MAG: molybdenum cofactor biosynthesis protein MoaE [Gammaproteobacteria bacterium]|jgi:molybdopterin synthase catalytic subunit|nr:molybdenum cofactor biosynthesis protein MoaE [Gammaproteobacteria bacterium]